MNVANGVGEAELDQDGVVLMLRCFVCGADQRKPETHCDSCGFDPNEEG